MAYINLPPSLQALIDGIVQRLTKLENGQRFTLPNVPVLTSQPTVTGLASGDPSEPRAGDAWMNTASNEVKYVDTNGATQVILPASAISSPAGIITAYGGTTAPAGYLLCNGNAISRTTYAALFAVLSTAYGAGDGSTTFNLPNLQGRFPVGQDGSVEFATNGQSGGNKTHSHTLSDSGWAQIARRGNNIRMRLITATSWTATDENTATSTGNTIAGTPATALGGSTDATSGAASIPPYQVVRYIIKY
jgi:microcystin-dependent protein